MAECRMLYALIVCLVFQTSLFTMNQLHSGIKLPYLNSKPMM